MIGARGAVNTVTLPAISIDGFTSGIYGGTGLFFLTARTTRPFSGFLKRRTRSRKHPVPKGLDG